jgi:GntR family transcriptional regulator / MocR family aminotransferase
LELPISLHREHHKTLQHQLINQIRQLILSKSLSAGIKLPSSRELSKQLNVSRNTVVGAYNKLVESGYLENRTGSGMFVVEEIPDSSISISSDHLIKDLASSQPVHLTSPPENKQSELYNLPEESAHYDFALEKTDLEAFPIKAWRRLLSKKLSSAASNMSRYQYPTGLPDLRNAILEHLAVSRGIVAEPNQVIIVTGIQQALNVVAQLYIREKTKVVIEAPGYRGASLLFQNYGAELIPTSVDTQGIVIEELQSVNADLALVTPSRQYPMCGIVPEQRRLSLIDWACQAGAYIVEIDYDSDFMYQGSPGRAIHALDTTNRVIYMSSFSKTLGPGLRLGYMIVPPEMASYAKSTKTLLDYGLPWLEQAVLAEFIKTGAFENHIKVLRNKYKSRSELLVKTMRENFSDLKIQGLECGTHLVWKLPDNVPAATKFKRMLSESNVGIHTLRHYSVYGADRLTERDRYTLLGFAAMEDRKINEGISRIAKMINSL